MISISIIGTINHCDQPFILLSSQTYLSKALHETRIFPPSTGKQNGNLRYIDSDSPLKKAPGLKSALRSA